MPTTRPLICVFAGSATPNDPVIPETAEALGKAIGEGGYDIICGGSIGVMGAVALAAHKAGAHVTTVILEKYAGEEQIAGATVLTVKTEAERFSQLTSYKNPVGLFVLPGSAGTLREAMQGLEKAIYEDGPSVILAKTADYLDGISHFFNHAMTAGLIKESRKGALREWVPGQSILEVLDGNNPPVKAKSATPKI